MREQFRPGASARARFHKCDRHAGSLDLVPRADIFCYCCDIGSTEEKKDDGAGVAAQGSSLQEPEFDVEVKLSDLQADPNNPLFSVKRFEDLGL